jgi:hypothetical protein
MGLVVRHDPAASPFQANPLAICGCHATLGGRVLMSTGCVLARVPRSTTPTSRHIRNYWLRPEGRARLGKQLDPSTYSCFACGRVPTLEGLPTSWGRLAAIWQLEKAHLVPHSLGGKARVANLVLLCHRCHLDIEPVIYQYGPDAALRWIAHHEPWPATWARSLAWIGFDLIDQMHIRGQVPWAEWYRRRQEDEEGS